MYISKISLKNIRGFESLDFDLDRGNGEFAGWTVFTGSNGSGESTLLKAIAYCLVPPDARVSLQPIASFFCRKSSVPLTCQIRLRFSPSAADDEIPANFSQKKPYSEDIHSYEEANFITTNSGALLSGVFSHHQADRRPSGEPLKGWFSCGYGPFRRITSPKENVEPIQRTKDSERFATLFLEAATLSEVDPWLTALRFQQLEGSQPAADQLAFFLDLMRDSLLPDRFFVDHVDSRGLWLMDSNGVELSWFDMSDGHRVAIILVADIVPHMIATFGLEGLYGRDEQGKIFLKRSGVVLIDEIDAHLHPSWQREIGFWLKRHFRKVQFLVTSHSPIILQAADPNGLFVLPEPGSGDEPRRLSDEEYRKIVASTVDTALLSEALGLQNTRSDEAVESRSSYSELIAKKHAASSFPLPKRTRDKSLSFLFPPIRRVKMRKIERVVLAEAIARELERYQAEVDGSPKAGFSATTHWEIRRRLETVLGVLATLKQMAGPGELCMYCVNNESRDIEHFRPKSEYRDRMYVWENLLLCCSICGGKKGKQFPTDGDQPLLIDPTIENPWEYLDFEPRTGNIMARVDPISEGPIPKGRETVRVFELNKRQALANGYKKTFGRLKTLVEELLQREFSDDSVERLKEADDHGLLGWCFGEVGQKVQPFSLFREAKPQEWAICQRAFA